MHDNLNTYAVIFLPRTTDSPITGNCSTWTARKGRTARAALDALLSEFAPHTLKALMGRTVLVLGTSHAYGVTQGFTVTAPEQPAYVIKER